MAIQGIEAIRELRDFSAAFDTKRFGLNTRVGFTYFVAQLLMQATWMRLAPASYNVTQAALAALESVAFVWVLHAVSGWGLIVAWGAVSAAMGALFLGALNLVSIEGLSVRVLDPPALASSFVFGALFMLGMVVLVRRWGLGLRTLALGGAAGLLVHALVFQALWPALDGGAEFRFDLNTVYRPVLFGLLQGGLVWAGVAWHVRTVPESAGGPRQHYFVCCGNPSLIDAFMGVYDVARAAGFGEYRRLRGSVFGAGFGEAKRDAAAARTAFPGRVYLGEQSWETSSLEQVLGEIQAGATQEVHVAYGVTTAARADWMRLVYGQLLADALKQGILPFRMYVTESEDAARALAGAFVEG